jgi:hypothetical protein
MISMRRLFIALIAALTLSAGTAQAQEPSYARGSGNLLTVHGLFSYYWSGLGVGVGVRYELPLVPGGLLVNAGIREDLALDFGADLLPGALVPGVGLLWNFHLTRDLTVYPKLELGYGVAWWDHYTGFAGPVFVQAVAGATLDLGKVKLRGELGSGMLLLGVALPM